ncbi:Six-hairpin glycosidase-like protein [Zychaea mexicana]|uniref:Six-hairpin glycosidase-like protein n=1 Tax=Zychaea mexicana TaxID=64656 RepID=UPI0022FF3172|nr:Six-hairpin glycosidase-like protein [Zychaea mexicana]KAI9475353.1 Six-hairpin glycosidase-like protein [Zychaea mexicana]
MFRNQVKWKCFLACHTQVDVKYGLYYVSGTGYYHCQNHYDTYDDDRRLALNDYVQQELDISWNALLRNINPPGSMRGFVAASPSTSYPDYFYTWTRDAALVMRVVVDNYNEDGVKRLLHDYVASEIYHQVTSTLCDCLGEPKFNKDGSGYDGSWGRPQNDGPASRAITMMLLAEKSHENYVKKTLVPAIFADLDYVADVWSTPCFDLFEESEGLHSYTLLVMRRALVDGARFASQHSDPGRAATYTRVSEKIRERLETFWDGDHVVVTQEHTGGLYKPSGLDVSVLLGVNQAGTYVAPPPCSLAILATAHALEKSFERLYHVNSAHPDQLGTAIGRYPEDTYDGYRSGSEGNPWFLATAGMAETYYRATLEWQSDQSSVVVNAINGPFFGRLLAQEPEKLIGTTFHYGTPDFEALVGKMTEAADRFMATIQYHQRLNGSLSEQFNRYTGFEQGARDLTWSYASFISAAKARNGRPVK